MAKEILEKQGCLFTHYEDLKNQNLTGYANFYIRQKWNESLLKNEAERGAFEVLYAIDNFYGTIIDKQLWKCCSLAVNTNIIQVTITRIVPCSIQWDSNLRGHFNVKVLKESSKCSVN